MPCKPKKNIQNFLFFSRTAEPSLDFDFIDNRNNLVFIGPPGVGKTHLSIGIGLKAVEAGYKVLFTNALSLTETLELAELKGELKKKIITLFFLPVGGQY